MSGRIWSGGEPALRPLNPLTILLVAPCAAVRPSQFAVFLVILIPVRHRLLAQSGADLATAGFLSVVVMLATGPPASVASNAQLRPQMLDKSGGRHPAMEAAPKAASQGVWGIGTGGR